jgi:hypothetical protein
MFPESLYLPAWIIITIAASFGAFIGLIGGGYMAKIFREGIRSMAMILSALLTLSFDAASAPPDLHR